MQAGAPAIGWQVHVLKAGTEQRFDAAFAAFLREQPDALLLAASPFFTPGVFNWLH